MKIVLHVVLSLLGGILVCLLCLHFAFPHAPKMATVDIEALTKSRVQSLAQSMLPLKDKINNMLLFEKSFHKTTKAYALKNHTLLFNKSSLIASPFPIPDITKTLFKTLPPNHGVLHAKP